MKIFKFYMVTILVVIASLCYVHQQVEIIRLNYILKDNEIEVAQLLDQNGALMYNIEKLENPHLLEERLNSNNVVLTMPERWHVTGQAGAREEKVKVVRSEERKRSIFDFLIPTALAHEKPTRE